MSQQVIRLKYGPGDQVMHTELGLLQVYDVVVTLRHGQFIVRYRTTSLVMDGETSETFMQRSMEVIKRQYLYEADLLPVVEVAERDVRTCKYCGCTADRPCIDHRTGPCSWVQDAAYRTFDVCSACVSDYHAEQLARMMEPRNGGSR